MRLAAALLLSIHGTSAGDLVRRANTSLRMPAELPGTGSAYRLVEALNGLTFEKPVAVSNPAGDNTRLFVVERTGRIIVVTNLANPTRTVFLDISSRVFSDWETGKAEGLSSVAFHPGYLTNRFPLLFVSYTLRADTGNGWENYNRVARFQGSRAQPNQLDPATEVPFITQIDHGPGHNINDLAFGPDGYLYIACGDEGDGGTGDDYNNAQRIDKNYFSGILRIDVDKRPGNLPPNPHPANTQNYFVPADNPWVGATSFNGKPVDPTHVLTEFYAVGLRNPWRMSFDPATGFLYEGDVGQHAREEINIIVKGGNYGWSWLEGTINGPKGPPPAGLTLIPPIHEHSPGYGPDQGFSTTGGVVYRGSKLPELIGAYIFADYVTGNVWSLRWDGNQATSFQRLTGHTGIAGFGVDPSDGEVLLIDHDRGKLYKLDYDNASGAALPPTLADTGAFSDLQSLTPNVGIVPYEVNLPFWSDGAKKERWFSVPDLAQNIGFDPQQNWTIPVGTIWVKHFELTNTISGVPKRLETRLLVKTATGVYGVTYRWGESATNAMLLPDQGLDESILVQDAGVVRTQIWHYPSRSECLACHTAVAGYALGFNTSQLNRDSDFGSGPTNQLRLWSNAGYFQAGVTNINALPALADLADSQVSREYRVRSFLTADCVQCHQPGGSAHGFWDARLTTPLANTRIIGGALLNNPGDPNSRVVQPGSPVQSALFTRISQLGTNHMPPLATTVIDTNAVNLLLDWITKDLPNFQDFPAWQIQYFGSTNSPAAAPAADPDQDGASNYLEYLTGSNPLQAGDAWRIAIQRDGNKVQILFPQAANRAFQVQSADDSSWPLTWQTLDTPENRPVYAATNRAAVVHDVLTNGAARLYRVSVLPP